MHNKNTKIQIFNYRNWSSNFHVRILGIIIQTIAITAQIAYAKPPLPSTDRAIIYDSQCSTNSTSTASTNSSSNPTPFFDDTIINNNIHNYFQPSLVDNSKNEFQNFFSPTTYQNYSHNITLTIKTDDSKKNKLDHNHVSIPVFRYEKIYNTASYPMLFPQLATPYHHDSEQNYLTLAYIFTNFPEFPLPKLTEPEFRIMPIKRQCIQIITTTKYLGVAQCSLPSYCPTTFYHVLDNTGYFTKIGICTGTNIKLTIVNGERVVENIVKLYKFNISETQNYIPIKHLANYVLLNYQNKFSIVSYVTASTLLKCSKILIEKGKLNCNTIPFEFQDSYGFFATKENIIFYDSILKAFQNFYLPTYYFTRTPVKLNANYHIYSNTEKIALVLGQPKFKTFKEASLLHFPFEFQAQSTFDWILTSILKYLTNLLLIIFQFLLELIQPIIDSILNNNYTILFFNHLQLFAIPFIFTFIKTREFSKSLIVSAILTLSLLVATLPNQDFPIQDNHPSATDIYSSLVSNSKINRYYKSI